MLWDCRFGQPKVSVFERCLRWQRDAESVGNDAGTLHKVRRGSGRKELMRLAVIQTLSYLFVDGTQS